MLRPLQIRQHLNFMQSLGHSPRDVLAGTSIDPDRFGDSSYLVHAHECHVVVANILRLSGDMGIGLKMGWATNLNDLGIVGYAMASSGTLGQAIGIWLQYGNSPVGFPFTLQVLERPGRGLWGVAAASNGVSGSVYRFYVEQIFSMGMSLGRQLTGRPFEVVRLELSYPAPSHAKHYARRFRCPIEFDAPTTCAILRAAELDVPVKSNDSEMKEVCIRHCSQLVRQISRHGPVSARLRNALMLGGSIPALDDAAAALNMSPRSLRRHLQGEGTSFQKVLDEFRGDLAREYIGAGSIPAKEVAFLLGFSKVDAFRRAFKNWTGSTIGGFRRASCSTH